LLFLCPGISVKMFAAPLDPRFLCAFLVFRPSPTFFLSFFPAISVFFVYVPTSVSAHPLGKTCVSFPLACHISAPGRSLFPDAFQISLSLLWFDNRRVPVPVPPSPRAFKLHLRAATAHQPLIVHIYVFCSSGALFASFSGSGSRGLGPFIFLSPMAFLSLTTLFSRMHNSSRRNFPSWHLCSFFPPFCPPPPSVDPTMIVLQVPVVDCPFLFRPPSPLLSSSGCPLSSF